MRKKAHLAILTLDFKPDFGGVQEYLYQISQRLASYCEVTVITPQPGKLPASTRFHRLMLSSAGIHHFWQALRRIQPTHVLVGHAHPRLLAAARFYGRYATMTHGNDYLAAQKRWHHFLFNKLMAHSSPLLTNSKANARRLTEIGLPPPAIIPPGTNPAQFFPTNISNPRETAILLTIGRLVPRKGIDTVLQALPPLLPTFPHLRYRIGSDGPDRVRLEQLVATLKLEKVVSFLGKIPPESLPGIYREAHIFVMPTREEAGGRSIEGFGIVYLEASASGLPVIASRSGGAVEAVQDGKTGILVPPNNPTAVAQAITTLLQDNALRLKMGQAGRKWIETTMNWERATKQLAQTLDIYE